MGPTLLGFLEGVKNVANVNGFQKLRKLCNSETSVLQNIGTAQLEYLKCVRFKYFNPYKPDVPFMGHRQNRIAPDVTPPNAASHLGLFCLLT